MFDHRRKIIGKSVYFVSENNGAYTVEETYNGCTVGKSMYSHRRIEDALQELALIGCERYYTDDSRQLNF